MRTMILIALLTVTLLLAGCGPERRTTFSLFHWTTEDK